MGGFKNPHHVSAPAIQLYSDPEVRAAFARFGTITNSRVLHRDNFSYAFLRFEKKDEAVSAIHEMNGETLNGTVIRASWGKPFVSGGVGSRGLSSQSLRLRCSGDGPATGNAPGAECSLRRGHVGSSLSLFEL